MRDLLKELKDKNIFISLEKGELKIKFNGPALPEELVRRIRHHKEGLVEYLATFNIAADYCDITPVKDEESYPLSPPQYRLWVLSQLEEGNVAYNMPGMYVFEGNLEPGALEHAFQWLILRHEILRTVFREDGQGEVRQFINPPDASGFRIVYHDLRQTMGQNHLVKELSQMEFIRPFDLSCGPLLRASLFRVEDKKWIFAYVMHHIIGDGWSMGVLMREMLQLYNSYATGEEHHLKPLRIQYKDYAAWHLAQLSGDSLRKHRNYWLNLFRGEWPALELPIAGRRPPIKTFHGAAIAKTFSSALSQGLKELVKQEGATLFMGLLSLVNTLLYLYTGNEDLVIGTPVIGREHVELEDQIGFYLNTVALRIKFAGKYCFREMLHTVKHITLEAYEHQAYPFDQLVDELHLQRDLSRNPLFDVMVILQNITLRSNPGTRGHSDLNVSPYYERETLTSKFDITFDFFESGHEIHVNVVYNRDIYGKGSIQKMIDHLERLFLAVVADPCQPIAELEYRSDEERHRLQADQEEMRSGFTAAISDEF